MGETARISVVGGSDISREGLTGLIVASGIAATCSSVADWRSLPPELDGGGHLIVLDADTEEQARTMLAGLGPRFTRSKIALICNDFALAFLKEGVASGVSGFLTKDIDFSTMLRKIQLVLSGQKVLPTRSIDDLICSETLVPPADWIDLDRGHKLSDREIGILRCLVDGDANKVISRRLNIAEPTVKVHVKAILRKLRVENRTQAAVWAINHRSRPDFRLN